jgi:ribosomal protein L29
VDAARKDLAAGIGGAEPSTIAEYRRQIAELTAEELPVPPKPIVAPPAGGGGPPPRSKAIEKLLKHAKDVFMSDLKGAEDDVDRALEMDPGNKDAQELQEKIRQRKEFLAK